MEIQGFIGASYRQTAQEVDLEDCVNLYPENMESPGAKTRMVLYGSPGLSPYQQVGTGPIRGELDIQGYTSVVSGSQYFRIAPDGTGYNVPLADVGNDGKLVQMVANDSQVLIVSAGNAFIHDGSGVNPVASPPWTSAVDCNYIDGFFVVLDDDGLPVGGQFFISALNDGTTWDPLDFSTAPFPNNKLLAIAVDHDELWLFGTVVTQIFYNNQGADFPFVPNTTAIVMQGIEARDTRWNLDNTLFWLGRNNYGTLQAFFADGYRAQEFSTRPLEQQWLKYTNPTDVVGWVYQINGHPTFHLNFNTDQKSWRFDRATNLWHRVAYRDPVTNQDEAHRGNCHCVRLGKHIVGDRLTNQLWELSTTAYKDGNDPLVAMRRAPAPYSANKVVFYGTFELITPAGIGDGSNSNPNNGPVTPEANPGWTVRWSNDNGHNYSNQFILQAGQQGQYGLRLRKINCGSGRNRVWEVSISAAVPRCLIAAEADMSVGDS